MAQPIDPGGSQLDETACIMVFHPSDNVGIALTDLEIGKTYPVVTSEGKRLEELRIPEEQPAWYTDKVNHPVIIRKYHKVAMASISTHGPVVKDQVAYAAATETIQPGQIVHQWISNEAGQQFRIGGNVQEYPNPYSPPQHKLDALAESYRILTENFHIPSTLRPWEEPDIVSEMVRVYPRSNGGWGSRNHLLVVPTVFCVNQEAQEIADAFRDEAWGEQNENYVHALTHTAGCCEVGFDEETTLRTLTHLATHPNVGAVLVVTLGCSPFCASNQLYHAIRERIGDRVRFVHVQEAGRSAAISEGKRTVAELLSELKQESRKPMPLHRLIMGVKCGGSDPTSGIFSNNAIGHLSDMILEKNGSVVISELMEYFGAERILKDRCRDYQVWLTLLRYIKANEMIGKAVAIAEDRDLHSVELTVGNNQAGLSTQEEKSLGAIRKMGFDHPIENIVRFGDNVAGAHSGLYVVDGPGQDLLSVSGLSTAGAQVILFSTGIGTPLGSAITPVIKVTGNANTYRKHQEFIDCFIPYERIIQEGASFKEITREVIFSKLLRVIEGERTRAEINHHRDFAIRHYAMVQ